MAAIDRAALRSYMVSLLPGGSRSRHLVYDLAHMTLPGGTTSLMVAATHSDPKRAVQLIDMLLANGADLGAKDHRGRQVLMFACDKGAHPSVIECLLKWNRKRAGWELGWADRDTSGKNAVVLASRSGHGSLVAFLLKKYARQTRYLEEYPLKLLQIAIESQHEATASDVLATKAIQLELKHSTTSHKIPCDPRDKTYNLFTCVQAAIRRGMSGIVLAMHGINAKSVERATWYTLYTLDSRARRAEALPLEIAPGLTELAAVYRRDWIWKQIHTLVPLRHCHLLSQRERERPLFRRVARSLKHKRRDWQALASHPLAALPDALFTKILSFLQLPEAEEAAQLQFWLEARVCPECMKLYIPDEGECRCFTERWLSRRLRLP
ncbi:hypothetical protein BBJ28_00003891 [Nothophytophthora sp. Chile5]|nr:hypothetical protein BBJ28_00003891 [Nothophytophthora sp. Chile5]